MIKLELSSINLWKSYPFIFGVFSRTLRKTLPTIKDAMTTITLKVIPQSGRQHFTWDARRGVLKCFLRNAPAKNKANDELIAFLAKSLGIARSSVAIISGHTSRTKRIRIDADLSDAMVYARLGVVADTQQGIPGTSSRS